MPSSKRKRRTPVCVSKIGRGMKVPSSARKLEYFELVIRSYKWVSWALTASITSRPSTSKVSPPVSDLTLRAVMSSPGGESHPLRSL